MHAGRPAPAVRGLLATVAALAALVCMLAPAAAARPGGSMRPLVARVRLHGGRLRPRRSHRSAGAHAALLRARAAVVGGAPIAIGQVPWQVVVIAFVPESETVLLCGGSILGDDEIVTAAHCVFNPSSHAGIPPEDIVVGAGTGDIETEPEQVVLANGVRVHPYYNPAAPPPAPDDVAVLQLEKTLVLNADVEPIAPIAAGSLLPEGTAVDLTGFGRQHPEEELNGQLYGIGMTLGSSRACGGEANALFLCASTPAGSLCQGDSGSGLTLPGAPVVLAGVADTVQVIDGKPCQPGAVGGFADLAAPEIRDFVLAGDESPPQAPRGAGAVIRGVPVAGETFSCGAGNWSNAPTFTYVFIDSNGGQVLQQGSSSTYALTAADVGRSILCEVLATNAGGTGVGRTPPLGPVQSNPQEEAARRKAEEEAMKQREEAARRKHAEEEAAASAHGATGAKGGVLAAHETARPKTPTRAQLLAKALGACRKQPTRRKRTQCEARAHRKYRSRKATPKGHKKK